MISRIMMFDGELCSVYVLKVVNSRIFVYRYGCGICSSFIYIFISGRFSMIRMMLLM